MVDRPQRVSLLKAEIRHRLSSSFVLDCKFEIHAGFSVLFGASGAGKTSILDCIAGIKRPESGRIEVDEVVCFDSAKKIDLPPSARRMAYVFQDLALFPHLSVLENVIYGLDHLRKETRQEVGHAVLARFGSGHLVQRSTRDLSGGERQRVALARSLVTNPRALLLDEPLAALDRATRLKMIDALQSWNEEHAIPILYVTHSVREALALGHRVLVVEAGQVIAQGTPAEVLDRESWE